MGDHEYKINQPKPIKKAVTIEMLGILDDGVHIEEGDHFKLREVAYPPTQEELDFALDQYLQYIICKKIIVALHKICGEKAYYYNLGIIDPVNNFTNFKEYVHKAILENSPEIIDIVEKEYQMARKANKVTGEYGTLFK